MNWNEVVEQTPLIGCRVKIIKPLRTKDVEYFKEGKVMGFKAGIYGGVHSNYDEGVPMSFDSSKQHWIKKPKVLVTYDIHVFGKGPISDWVPVDNCIFEL